MKKLIALLFIISISLSLLSSCAKKEEFALSIGVAEAVDYENGVIRQSVAAVVTDANGKIVLTRLDAVEYEVKLDGGEAVIYVPLAIRDEVKNNSFIQAANALEASVKGMTKAGAEAALAPDENEDDSYTQDLSRAVLKALASNYPTKFSSVPDLSAGVSLFANAAIGTEKDKDDQTKEIPTLTLGVSFAAIAAEGGRVRGAVIDENELTVKLDGENGKITAHSYVGTKLEQGEDYHMDDYNPYAIGEWYEQAAAYVKELNYKPVDRIDTLPEGTTAGCTIDTANYFAAVIKASRRVR